VDVVTAVAALRLVGIAHELPMVLHASRKHSQEEEL
jgi:hypothetical protein